MAKEISKYHEYQGCPLLVKLQPVQSTRAQTSRDDSLCNNVEDALHAAGKIVRPVIPQDDELALHFQRQYCPP